LKKIFFLFLISALGFAIAFAQNDKEKLGESLMGLSSGSFYNFSDKNKVNIEVNIWGFVRNPGKYLIPKGCSVQDLISYAGGPTLDAHLDEIRLYRPKNDSLGISEDKVINFDYYDLLWSEKVDTKRITNYVLEAGDILVFPGSPKKFLFDNLTLLASFATVVITLLILIIDVKRN
jgi:polysaccharide biosynthesis/export protein